MCLAYPNFLKYMLIYSKELFIIIRKGVEVINYIMSENLIKKLHEEDAKDFGRRLKEAMEIRGMKQSELSQIAKIDKGSLSSYISGRYMPRSENMKLIAETLDINEAWLAGYSSFMDRIRDFNDEWNEKLLLEKYIKSLGWTYTLNNHIEGYNCEECLNGVFTTENHIQFCEHCKLIDERYIFTNGKISFKVSDKDFNLLINNIRANTIKQIQLLFSKTTENLFNDSNHGNMEGDD
jgi:transcriptional regulator with XRE-family HTH domain